MGIMDRPVVWLLLRYVLGETLRHTKTLNVFFEYLLGNGGKTGSLKVGAQIKIIKKSPCNVTPSRSLLSRLQDVPFLSSVIRNQRSALVFLILLLAILTTRRYVR